VTRWITAGETLSWVSADEAAIALGLHPILVWGEAWLNVRGELTDLEAEVIGDLETEALTDL
jgi:hypothetical protein